MSSLQIHVMSSGVMVPSKKFPDLFCCTASWRTGSDLKQVCLNKCLGRWYECPFVSNDSSGLIHQLNDPRLPVSCFWSSHYWVLLWLWGAYKSTLREAVCILHSFVLKLRGLHRSQVDVHKQKSSLAKKAFIFMLKGKRAKKEPMNIRGVDTEFTATKRERSLLPVFFFFF